VYQVLDASNVKRAPFTGSVFSFKQTNGFCCLIFTVPCVKAISFRKNRVGKTKMGKIEKVSFEAKFFPCSSPRKTRRDYLCHHFACYTFLHMFLHLLSLRVFWKSKNNSPLGQLILDKCYRNSWESWLIHRTNISFVSTSTLQCVFVSFFLQKLCFVLPSFLPSFLVLSILLFHFKLLVSQ